MSTKTTTRTNRIAKPQNGAAQVEAPASDPHEATRDERHHIEYGARHEYSIARKRDLLFKVREMRAAAPGDRDDQEMDLECAAETLFIVQPIRDSLLKWADEQPTVMDWDLFQNEDGSCFFELKVSVPNEADSKVRLVIMNEGG